MNQYKEFYKKSVEERIEILEKEGVNFSHNQGLSLESANQMIENAIGLFEMPLGVAPQFLINQKIYHVPMVTEEPSVIAAASHGAKIIRENGGFSANVLSRIMRGQIAFILNEDLESFVKTHQNQLKEIADEAYPSIVKRGGGVIKIQTRNTSNFSIVDVFMDTKEAMGANMLNTVLEALANYLETNLKETSIMSILSNLSTECMVEVQCEIDPTTLKFDIETAKKIEQASQLAHEDIYRATTHNKGIMNGIDAVVIATGNDYRAVEAAAHAYAASKGKYKPLTTWELKDGRLLGKIKLPMPLGSVGGSMGAHPKIKLVHSILDFKDASNLMEIVASVGLAQNFAALYALVTDGIQKGHMALQMRNLAIQAGASLDILNDVVSQLLDEPIRNIDVATRIVNEIKDT